MGAARGFREAYICTVTQIHVSDIQHATETLCIALTGDGLRVLNTIPTFATGSGQEFENRKVCSVGGRRRLVPSAQMPSEEGATSPLPPSSSLRHSFEREEQVNS